MPDDAWERAPANTNGRLGRPSRRLCVVVEVTEGRALCVVRLRSLRSGRALWAQRVRGVEALERAVMAAEAHCGRRQWVLVRPSRPRRARAKAA